MVKVFIGLAALFVPIAIIAVIDKVFGDKSEQEQQ